MDKKQKERDFEKGKQRKKNKEGQIYKEDMQ